MPIIAVVLLLTTGGARRNGPAFVVGWVTGLAVIGVIVPAIAGPAAAGDQGQPETWVIWRFGWAAAGVQPERWVGVGHQRRVGGDWQHPPVQAEDEVGEMVTAQKGQSHETGRRS